MLNEVFDRRGDAERARELNIKRPPLGRIETAEDVSYLTLFLSPVEVGVITGGTFVIGGGASLPRRWKD